MKQNDELFILCVFGFLLTSGNTNILLSLESKKVEGFLRRIRPDLLCKYFIHHNDYKAAADELCNLADHLENATPQDRKEYATIALSMYTSIGNTEMIRKCKSKISKYQ